MVRRWANEWAREYQWRLGKRRLELGQLIDRIPHLPADLSRLAREDKLIGEPLVALSFNAGCLEPDFLIRLRPPLLNEEVRKARTEARAAAGMLADCKGYFPYWAEWIADICWETDFRGKPEYEGMDFDELDGILFRWSKNLLERLAERASDPEGLKDYWHTKENRSLWLLGRPAKSKPSRGRPWNSHSTVALYLQHRIESKNTSLNKAAEMLWHFFLKSKCGYVEQPVKLEVFPTLGTSTIWPRPKGAGRQVSSPGSSQYFARLLRRELTRLQRTK